MASEISDKPQSIKAPSPSPCSPHLLHWGRWSFTKMNLDHAVPTMHSLDAGDSSFLVAQPTPRVPWRSCPCSTAVMVSDVFPGIQEKREWVARMLVATLVGHKKLTGMQIAHQDTQVPMSCFPHVSPLFSQCRSSAETFLKHSELCLAMLWVFFKQLVITSQQGTTPLKLGRICCFLKKDKQKTNAMGSLLVFNKTLLLQYLKQHRLLADDVRGSWMKELLCAFRSKGLSSPPCNTALLTPNRNLALQFQNYAWATWINLITKGFLQFLLNIQSY